MNTLPPQSRFQPGRPRDRSPAGLSGLPALLLAAAVAVAGCATPGPGRRPEGALPPGAPPPTASPEVIDRVAPDSNPPASAALRLPDRIEIPATYRLMLLDGHLTLVRETDAIPLPAGTASLRIVTGEIARGEIAYQPALLPQELAAEVAAFRTRTAQLDEALATVLERSQGLSDQARAIADENRRLNARLATAEENRPAPVPVRPAAGTIPAPAAMLTPAGGAPTEAQAPTPAAARDEPASTGDGLDP